mgnify:FL=1
MSTKKQQSARVPGKPNGRIKAAKFAFEGEKLQIPAWEDYTEWIESLYTTFGTTDTDTLCLFADQIQKVVAPGCDDQAKALNQAIPVLLAIKPEKEVETMLAAQMIGIHTMSMTMMRRAMSADQTVEGVNNNVNRVTKLSRTFISLLEALNKHRGKGKQKITVEHVTVNEGGQAIVGNVEHGGRDEKKK